MTSKIKEDQKAAAERALEHRELLDTLHKTQDALNKARIDFNNVSAPELIDSSVFEINSLQARYNYLLRRLREEGVADSTRLLR